MYPLLSPVSLVSCIRSCCNAQYPTCMMGRGVQCPACIMGRGFLCLTLFSLLAGTYAQTPCTLIMPNLLRVESEETIILDAQSQTVPFEAEILIQDLQKVLIITKAKVSLNSGNGFLGKVDIKVPGTDFRKDAKKKQHVYVLVKSNVCNLEKLVLLSFHSGYIFIQTDKTIYNPGTTVLYRLFITGHYLEPDKRTVDVEFITPDGIMVMNNQLFSNDDSGIVQKSFLLPEIANDGIWKIACKFQDAPQEVFQTEFEVKEYVLPSFEVLLDCPQNYYFADDNDFTVEINAKFLHGKLVEGAGHAIFGAIVNNEKRSFPASLTKFTLKNGAATVTLQRYMITGRYPDPTFLVGSSLYVTVVVLTNAGSDLVEAERTDIPVVNTAFKILSTKSSKYFKPGLPYILKLVLQSPNGSPASRVEVCTVDNKCALTSSDGIAEIVINTKPEDQEMQIHVRTKAADIPERRQTTYSFTVTAYKPQQASGNYLHIGITATKVKPGDTLQVQFYVKNKNTIVQKSISHITYLILSKGRVIKMDRQERQPDQTLTVMSLVITEKHIPAFRIVAYYAVPTTKEIVSDSVWVDTVDSCIRKLELTQDPNKLVIDPQPGSVLTLKLTGEPGAKVGLVAVDKAVFVLNKKNRMSQDKIWKQVEQSDLGCTPGGGVDNAGVFTDAGLAVESNIGLKNPLRDDLRCAVPQRRKRSLELTGPKAEKANQYEKDARLKQCCVDGMQENPMGYKCQKRAEYVLDAGECAQVFLECCKFIFEPQVIRGRPRKPTSRADAIFRPSSTIKDGGSDDDYEEMDNIKSRSIFYESWWWKVETLPMRADSRGYSSLTVNANLPESITTWEFLAISISPISGICVAQPYEMLVKKKFFIDLRLPYSVVRNEQVEIRAVLYSYVKEPIEVRVDLIFNKKMCSSATAEANFRQVVILDPFASLVLPIVVVPLEIGYIPIEVKASVKDYFFTDGVIKQLKVVPEGMRILKTIQSLILDPQRAEVPGIQIETIEPVPPKDIVPNTEADTYVSVKGSLLGETLENSIDGANLKHLITVPAGCGEQNMMSMTPTVIATRFLDVTEQWERLGVERREEAIKNINLGYVQQLVYRKSDHSYSAFTNRPSSTWLTAYVVKVFSMAFKLIHIDKDVLCGAVKWLISEKQLSNGAFKEDAPVIHGEMVGGSGNTEPDASLAAFVLIALVEAKSHCNDRVPDLESSLDKSAVYLEGRLKTVRKPYTICITSYALSLLGKLPNSNQLIASSTDGTHWAGYSSDLYIIEATSYALLALLKLNHYSLAEPVTRWLTEQRFFGGGYGSTQATIMVFQAMSEYQIHVPLINEIELDVTLALPGRRETVNWRINKANAMSQRSEKTEMKHKMKVTAKGKGQGTLTVMSAYYVPLADGAVPCKNFDFTVTLQDAPKAKKPIGVLNTMFINICMKFLGVTDSTMTIVDLTLLTGFTPDMGDLNSLTNRVDKYISKYEMDTERSERGSLIMYLDKVSRSEVECLKFKIHQNFEVGVLQPAQVTIYEYYALENRCTKFYHPTEEQGELKKICRGAECHCISERCNLKNAYKGKLDSVSRVNAACQQGVDFVYECRVDNIEKAGAYDTYSMTITQVVKLGTDELTNGAKRQFFSHRSCRDSVKASVGRTYIIWGRSEDIWEMNKEKSYVINGGTWFEQLPTKRECATIKLAECEEIYKFIDELQLLGCRT
ncbi:complement C3-like [Mixophyes fleayi]|uniref:complement C3-like n=1 Tax=Mixophyes fleayi TaxID=3061075 RepID=UPI003F4DAADD